MKKFYRYGLWQILTGIISGIFIAILAVGCVLIAIDLNNVISAEKIVGIFVDVLMLAGLLYIFCSLFRSYVIIGDYEISVTANVGKTIRWFTKPKRFYFALR